MRQHSASMGSVIQGKFLNGGPALQTQTMPVPAPKPLTPPPPVAVQPKMPARPPVANAHRHAPTNHPGPIQPKQLIPGKPVQPQMAQPVMQPYVPKIQAGVKPAPPPLQPIGAPQPAIQPKQLIPGHVAQLQNAQPTVAPHVLTIQAGVKPAPPPLRPFRQTGSTAQPKVAVQLQTNSGLTAQKIPNGNAFQLPSNLANFGNKPGQPLPDNVRQKMESYFKTDFSDVRIHVGPEAPSIGALAFTQGNNLHFAPGQYNPHTNHGQQLLGRELTHVVQQRAGRVRNPFGSAVAVVQDGPMEAEADHMGRQAAAQRTVQFKSDAGTGRSNRTLAQLSPVGNKRPTPPVASPHWLHSNECHPVFSASQPIQPWSVFG